MNHQDGSPILEHLLGSTFNLYRSLDSVFVFDYNGYAMNGLGNSLMKYTKILGVGPVTGRAVFIKRDEDGCGGGGGKAPCRMDPGAYFGMRERRPGGPFPFGTADWRWTAAARAATAARMEALGQREHVFNLSTSVPGLFDSTDNSTVLARAGMNT